MPLEEPIIAGNFILEMDKARVASVSEVAGMDLETESVDTWVTLPDGKLQLYKSPAKPKYGQITAKRPIDSDKQLYEWYAKSLKTQNPDGKASQFIGSARGTLSIILQDVGGTEIIRWNALDAWVCSYKVNGADASKNEVMKEEVKINHHGVIRVK